MRDSQAGYEYITTNNSYHGGAVRQFENLSFSRIFQAGHFVNAYQPETAYKSFERLYQGHDIATGLKDTSDGYSTEGPASTLAMYNGSLPDPPPMTCMIFGEFQKTSPWDQIFAFVQNQGANSASDSGVAGDNGQGGSAPTSMSVRVQPGGILAVSVFVGFVAAGLSFVP